MAKQIKQFRFYDSNEGSKNQPVNSTSVDFVSGKVFDTYLPAYQFGIQALPGTKFYLNEAPEPVIIGLTGIYELDLDGQTEINKIQIDKDSIQLISNNASAYLIVDLIYSEQNIGEKGV